MQPILEDPSPLRVAIVAPTLGILGGHAVQAQSMLAGWAGDPAVGAWLVPINPTPPRWLRWCLRVKYVRTVATQLCYWPLLARELRRADVAHIFSASSSGFLLSTVPAVLVSKALGTPVLLNYHSGEAQKHLSGSALARFVLRRGADLHVVPSTFLRDVFRGFGLSARVVANTIDLRRFRYRVRDPLRPRLLSTRNFEPVYNIECTLRAFAYVQAAVPEAALTIVGDGSGREDLEALARSLGLRHVTFAGRVPPSEMPGFYAAADIYVQTPVADNMPVSVLEAFASGLPVVSTDVGGVSGVLTGGVHGLLARNNDPVHVTEQILHLLDHPEEARRLASAACESCRAFEWTSVRDAWLAAYHTTARPRSEHAVSIEAA